ADTIAVSRAVGHNPVACRQGWGVVDQAEWIILFPNHVASKISRWCCALCEHAHSKLGRSAHNPEGTASLPGHQRFYRLVRGYGEGQRFTRCRYHCGKGLCRGEQRRRGGF